MRRLFILIFVALMFLVSVSKANAAYDPRERANNIFGIHITNLSDIDDAATLVNSSGGNWGYVTIVINQDQRDRKVWQDFLDRARKLNVVPIIRIATKIDGDLWTKPDLNEIDSWVNFFNSLNWVSENRYLIIGNEPNHAKEWGGEINPAEYANYLKTFSEKLQNAHPDYFVLPAGFDQAATDTEETMDQALFIEKMLESVPESFHFIDGWNSHSYPNPDFSASPKIIGRKSVKGYLWEMDILKSFGIDRDLPIFITETGWSNTNLSEDEVTNNYLYAFNEVWLKDNNIVAVTPFILNYTQAPFDNFSWKKSDGRYIKIYEEVQKIIKVSGKPKQFIDGKILFSYLTSTGIAGSHTTGYMFVENTGQNIWSSSNSFLVQENGDSVKISEVELKEIFPFSGKFIGYTLTFPKEEGEFDLKIGLYVEEKRVAEVFNGKVYTYINSESISQNVVKRLSLIFSKVENIRS